MPIYEYQCNSCHHEFEVTQRMSDAALSDCPACGEPQLRKKISASAFHLKGNGWYKTDFKGEKKAETDAKLAAAPAVAKADESGDSKPAAAKESSSPAGETPPVAKPAASEAKPASAT